MKVTRTVCRIYAAICAATLVLLIIGTLGWLGIPGRPGVLLADVLGMPWSLLVAQVSDAGAVGKVVMGAAAMALNLAIIFSVGRWLTRRA
ncbi:hypothetical protein [Phenylobacterium sp.]|uniref:hypothetical protein n=1 Tax=Phenylobacterium sp. TaxID=1871053 RepID=UPI002ED99055